MTYANSLPQPWESATLPADERDRIFAESPKFWCACDRCHKAFPGPGWPSEAAAACAALGAGWLLKQPREICVPLAKAEDVFLDCEMFCWNCATEFK